MTDQPQTEPFRSWAIVEIFGHERLAGEVSEQTIAGAGFIRVDVPALDGAPAFTRFYGDKAIYSITPVAEPTATATQPAPPASLSITTLSGTSITEYVIITNIGGSAQDMTGWRLVSAIGPQTYFFPNGYSLGPGATVRIESYTGAASNPPAVLFWTSAAVRNNAGDRAELYSNTNALIDSECYGSGCP